MTQKLSISAFNLQGRLLLDLPSGRFRLARENCTPPKTGDIVGLDQGFTGKDGKPMTLAYGFDNSGNNSYEAELYDSDFEPVIAD